MARPLRIVCYAVNGSGLGHVTRLLAIARWLRRLEAMVAGVAPEIVFLTSTEATGLLSDARMAALKLPSKGVARAAGLDVVEHRRLAKHFVWQTLGVLAPDLLIVDTFPQGSFDELLPVLDGPFTKVLVLRDVKPELGQRPIFQAALRMYDRVVVPHAPGAAPDVAALLGDGAGARWVGDVLAVDQIDPVDDDRRALRRELGVESERRLVYISAGGGGDPGSEAALRAIVLALPPDVHALVGAGPLYRGARLTGPRLTWFTEPDVARFFPALDAAISAGGYNTVHELMHLGVPAAFFAQDKIADRQAERIAGLARVGACLVLPRLDAATIGAALTTLFANGDSYRAAARRAVPDNGARFAAAEALATLPGRDVEATLGSADLLGPRLARALDGLGQVGVELLTRGLGQLDPTPGLSSLGTRAALDPLLPQLSAEARAEVLAALQRRSTSAARRDVEAALLTLIATADGAVELVPGLLEAALRKHPRAQEPPERCWAVELLVGLTGVVRGDARARAPLYKAFPRVIDAPAKEAFAAFERLVQEHPDGESLLRSLQGLKLQRRVTLAHVAALRPLGPRGEA